MTKRKTKEEIKNFVNNLGYNLLNDYIKNNHRRIFISNKLGYKFDVLLSSFIKKSNTNFIDKSNTYTLENISLWLKLNDRPFKLCDDNVYDGAHKKLKFHCSICNHVFSCEWAVIYSNGGCGGLQWFASSI